MQRKPRVGSRWDGGTFGVVTVSGYNSPDSDWAMCEFTESKRPFAAGIDGWGLDAFGDCFRPLDPDPWEPADEATSAGAKASESISQAAVEPDSKNAVKGDYVPATPPYVYGQKVVAGMLECFFSAPREPAKMVAAVERHEAAIVKQPSPRPGQRWSDGRYEYAILDEESHKPETGLNRYAKWFLCRRDDGLRVMATSHDVLGAWTYVSGPTEQETSRQAIERVVKLEADYPAAGETAGTWLRVMLRLAEGAGRLVGAPSGTLLVWRDEKPCHDTHVTWSVDANWIRGTARRERGHSGPWHGAVAWEAGDETHQACHVRRHRHVRLRAHA